MALSSAQHHSSFLLTPEAADMAQAFALNTIGAAMAVVGALQMLAPSIIACALLALWLLRPRSALA